MTAVYIYVPLATVATLACAVLAWRHWRANAPAGDELSSVAGQYPPPDDDAQTFAEHTAQAMDLIHDATFYEEDEPVDAVVSAFHRGKKGVTEPPWTSYRTYSCIHTTVSGPLTGPPLVPCGCDMQEEK